MKCEPSKCLCIHAIDGFETFCMDENTIGVCPLWFDASKHPSPSMQTVHLLVKGKVIVGWNEAVQPEEDPSYCTWEYWPEDSITGSDVTHWAPLLKAPTKEQLS